MSCLRFCCDLNAICSVAQATDATPDGNVASSLKRPPQGEQDSRPQKRGKNTFKITTPNDFCGT